MRDKGRRKLQAQIILFFFLLERAATKKIACLSATMVCIGEIIIFANMQGDEKERVHANAPLVNVTAGGK